MPRTETTRTTYETVLCGGLDESPRADHQKFVVRVERVTELVVRDGRGRNYSAGSRTHETLAELNLVEAGQLAAALVNDITFAAEVGEKITLDAAAAVPAAQ